MPLLLPRAALVASVAWVASIAAAATAKQGGLEPEAPLSDSSVRSSRMMRRGAAAKEDQSIAVTGSGAFVVSSGHAQEHETDPAVLQGSAISSTGELTEEEEEDDEQPVQAHRVLLSLLPTEELSPDELQDLRGSLRREPSFAKEMLEAARHAIAGEFTERAEQEKEYSDEAGQAELALEKAYVEAIGKSDGTDVSIRGLTHNQAVKYKILKARVKTLDLLVQMKNMSMGDPMKVNQLIEDFIEGRTGPAILKSLVKETDKVPEPSDLEAKVGDILDAETFMYLERWLTNSSKVKDLMTRDEAPPIPEGARALLSKRDGDVDFFKNKMPNPWPKDTNGRVSIKFCRGPGLTNQAWGEFKKASNNIAGFCDTLDFSEVATGSSDCRLTVKGNEDGCWAHVGYWGGNQLNLKDGSWYADLFTGTCATSGIAEHELLHSLGFYHQQSRYDRDGYVQIYNGNIHSGQADQFTKQDTSMVAPYTLGSIMHYGCKAFSTSMFKDTIRANRRRSFWDGYAGRKDCQEMGQRTGLNTQDIRSLQALYTCKSRSR